MITVNEFDSYVSVILVSGAYLSPDDREDSALVSYERAGIGLNDSSEGINYQDWTLTYNWQTGNVEIEAANHPISTLFTRSGITEICLSFDHNMNPFVAFVENGVAKFWWWDTEVNNVVFSDLPVGSVTPRSCMDDKGDYMNAVSDILLCYVHEGALKMRIQRNRYIDEEIIQDPFVLPGTDQPAYLKKVGMNEHNRIQWTGSVVVQ